MLHMACFTSWPGGGLEALASALTAYPACRLEQLIYLPGEVNWER
jgi:hypothetical protein